MGKHTIEFQIVWKEFLTLRDKKHKQIKITIWHHYGTDLLIGNFFQLVQPTKTLQYILNVKLLDIAVFLSL